MVDETYKFTDVLEANYAYLAGGRSRDYCSIITFADIDITVNDEQTQAVLSYFLHILRQHEADPPVAIIIDRRRGGGWPDVKSLLRSIFDVCKSQVQHVFVLHSASTFQRLFSSLRLKTWALQPDELAKVVFLDPLTDLYQYVDQNQLTAELGGTLEFNSHEWITAQLALEKILSNADNVREQVNNFCTNIKQPVEGQAVSSASIGSELDCQTAKHSKISDCLLGTLDSAKQLVECFKMKNIDGLVAPSRLIQKITIERLIGQLEDEMQKFSNWWEQHYEEQMQQLCAHKIVEQHSRLVEKLQEHRTFVDSLSITDVAESLNDTKTQLNELEEFRAKFMSDYSQIQKLATDLIESNCRNFIETENDITVLTESFSRCRQCFEKHYEQLQCVLELQERVAKFQEKLTEHQSYVNSLSVVDVADNLNDVKCREGDLKRFEHQFVISYDEVRQLETDIKELDCKDLIEKHISVLVESFGHCQQQMEQHYKQLQYVTELHEQIAKMKKLCDEGSNLLEDSGESSVKNLSQFVDNYGSMGLDELWESHSMYIHVVSTSLQDSVQQTLLDFNEIITKCKAKLEELERLRLSIKAKASRLTSSQSLDVVPQGQTGVKLLTAATSLSLPPHQHLKAVSPPNPKFQKRSSFETADASVLSLETDSENSRRTRQCVIQELIETEKVYTLELNDILQGYAAQIDNPEMRNLVTSDLRENRAILFTNIDEIHRLHSTVFLKALESCGESVIGIANCFLQHKTDFDIYSVYCQKKTSAENLIEHLGGEQNTFFLECKRRLGHSLPLHSYLLKPVQRLPKYKLLLAQLSRVCITREEAIVVKEALEAVCDIIQYVNDVMHQQFITSYDGDLSEFGRLLMQGELEVWNERKKDKALRHVFLYEKCFLLCKKKKDDMSQLNDCHSYVFKSIIWMNQVGLREVVKTGDDRRFELSVSSKGGRSLDVWIMQAATKELKLEWVSRIKKLLMKQFFSIRRKKQSVTPTLVDIPTQNNNTV